MGFKPDYGLRLVRDRTPLTVDLFFTISIFLV
jgi:hypothetical protein